jgi:hypothetical protein
LLNNEYIEVLVGGLMMVIAVAVAFFMVIGFLEKDLLISFVTYAASLAGFAIGLHGIFMIHRTKE